MIYLLIGPPCSGKSTWSKNKLKQNSNCVRFNRDDLRIMLSNTMTPDKIVENTITKMINNGIKNAIEEGKDVIIDQTNCKSKYIDNFIEEFGYITDIQPVYFDISLEELLKRNQLRSLETKMLPIPENIIINMYKNYKQLINNFNYPLIRKLKNGKYMV